MGRLILHTESSSSELENNFHVKSVENFAKLTKSLLLALIWFYLESKGGRKVPLICLWTKFRGSIVTTFFVENNQKNFKTIKFGSILYHWNLITRSEAKENLNSNCTGFGAILLCTSKPNIGKIGEKLREPMRFEQKWTDDDDNDDGLCQQRS